MATELPSDPFELRHAATDRATFVTVPERRMFAIDGLGDPRLAAFVLASDSLRAVEERVRGRVQRTTGRRSRRRSSSARGGRIPSRPARTWPRRSRIAPRGTGSR